MQRIKGHTQLCLLAALLKSFVGVPLAAAALLAAPDPEQGCPPARETVLLLLPLEAALPCAALPCGSPALPCPALRQLSVARSVVKVGVGARRLRHAPQEDALAGADLCHLAVISKPARRQG